MTRVHKQKASSPTSNANPLENENKQLRVEIQNWQNKLHLSALQVDECETRINNMDTELAKKKKEVEKLTNEYKGLEIFLAMERKEKQNQALQLEQSKLMKHQNSPPSKFFSRQKENDELKVLQARLVQLEKENAQLRNK